MNNKSVFDAISSMGNFSPVVTIAEFSRLTGMSEPAVRKSVQRGYLPILRIGRGKIMINLVKILSDCLDVDLTACDNPALSPGDLWDEDAEEYWFQFDSMVASYEAQGCTEDEIDARLSERLNPSKLS